MEKRQLEVYRPKSPEELSSVPLGGAIEVAGHAQLIEGLWVLSESPDKSGYSLARRYQHPNGCVEILHVTESLFDEGILFVGKGDLTQILSGNDEYDRCDKLLKRNFM